MACMYIQAGKYNELRQIFDKLSEGADKELLDDLRYLPFGRYGHLADKYGVHWFSKAIEWNSVVNNDNFKLRHY